MSFLHPVTSLEGDTPRARSPYVRGSRHRHSHHGSAGLRIRAFGGQKLEAPPYPRAPGFCGSAPSPDELTGKGFLFAPFVVELFPVGCFARSPGQSGPVVPVTRSRSPHAGPGYASIAALVPWPGFAPVCPSRPCSLPAKKAAAARLVPVAPLHTCGVCAIG